MAATTLINYSLYQVGWFACVLGAAWRFPLVGTAIAVALIAVHAWLARERTIELRLMALALVVGLSVEVIQVLFLTYTFTSGVIVAGLPPPWMLALWVQLATAFRYSLRHVFARPVPSMLFGALGGPLAFVAGERLGAITLLPPLTTGLLRLSLCWTVAMLVFHLASRRIIPQEGAAYR